MSTTRRELVTRAAAIAGAAWVAPELVHATAASALTCTCYAFKIDNLLAATPGACTQMSSASTGGGSNCNDMNAAWTAKLGANCTTYGSCVQSGATVDWSMGDGDSDVVVTFPAGVEILFLGARYNNGCHWLNCASFTTSCTTVAKDATAGGTCGTPSCAPTSCLCWDATNRKFKVSVTGVSGSTGISHIVFAYKKCGS